jgi:hypothetical protein
MSYCPPLWASDYTFRALFDRGTTLATTRTMRGATSRAIRWVMQDADGSLRWHGASPLTTTETFGGTPLTVRYLGSDDRVLGTGTAHRYAYDHVAGSSIVVPEGPSGTVRIALDGVGMLAR